jgi:hypothetical protein
MPDFIKIAIALTCIYDWQKRTGIKLTVCTDTQTGEIITKSHGSSITTKLLGRFEELKLVASVTQHFEQGKYSTTTCWLEVAGSIHKNAFNKENVARLYHSHFKAEILRICEALMIDPKQAKLKCLEIGVNVETDIEVDGIINDRLLMYSTKPFIDYSPDRTGKSIGKYAKLSEYVVKCYNKGLQFSLSKNLLRLELRFLKMRKISKQPVGIVYLSDLLDVNKIREASKLLLAAWGKVFLYDPFIPEEIVPEANRRLLLDGENLKYWINLHKDNRSNRKPYYEKKDLYQSMIITYGQIDISTYIQRLLTEEIEELLG